MEKYETKLASGSCRNGQAGRYPLARQTFS